MDIVKGDEAGVGGRVRPDIVPHVHHRRLAMGTMLMAASNVFKVGIQLISLPLIARLLGPSQYGLFGLAMPAVALMLMLADSGLGQSLAREPESNSKVWSSAFWFLLVSGVVLAIGLSLVSFLIAEVAHVPQLPPIMMALSGCLILLTLALPSNALLTRQGRIGINSLGETIGSIVGSAAAIALAFNGAGTWSLVAQTLLIYIFRTSYVLLAAPFKPAWHFAMKDLRPHLAMGRSIVGSRLADTGGRMAESTLIARLLGAGMVGTYSFANQAPRFICDSVGNSLWVMLYAHTIRTEDTAEAMNTYRIVLRTFGLVVFPVVILVAAQAHELIFHLLGPKWGNSVFMLQVILIFYSVTTLGGLGMPILYAKGRSDIQFKIACESAALRIGCVCCAPWIGMNGVAIGFGVAYTYVFVRYVLVMRNFLGIPIAPYFAVVAGPAFAATVAGILCWRLGRLTHPGFMLMVGEMALGLIMYGLVLLALERRRLMQDWRAVRQLMKRA